MFVTDTTEGTDVRWIQAARGRYETTDGLWRARCIIAEPRSRRLWVLETCEDGDWCVVEPCKSLREAQLWVAQNVAQAEQRDRELWIDEAIIEAGAGTIHRLRVMRGQKILREALVRGGRVHVTALAMESNLTADETRAYATALMQAAELTGEED